MMMTMTIIKTAWEDDELDDDENFLRERARCRLERLQMQQKKTRKKTSRRYQLIRLLIRLHVTQMDTHINDKQNGINITITIILPYV